MLVQGKCSKQTSFALLLGKFLKKLSNKWIILKLDNFPRGGCGCFGFEFGFAVFFGGVARF
jgi:hypothetical protein